MKIKKIRQLVKLLEDSSVSEIEVQYFGGRSIRVSKEGSQETKGTSAPQAQARKPRPAQQKRVQPSQPQQKSGEQATTGGKEKLSEEKAEEEEAESGLQEIESPIVGTFYRAPSPDDPPFVEEGKHISVGQVVCIVEAMKVMNEIKSELSGVVKEVCVEDSEPVEYGQTLFKVKEE